MSQLRNRNYQESARHGSRTLTITENFSEFDNENPNHSDNPSSPVGRIQLTGGPDNSESRRIRWDENVIDNEGMGKKKSKICCIYHKPRPVGESDSDETDSDDSSNEQTYRGRNIGSPNAYERAPRYKKKACNDNCHHSH